MTKQPERPHLDPSWWARQLGGIPLSFWTPRTACANPPPKQPRR